MGHRRSQIGGITLVASLFAGAATLSSETFANGERIGVYAWGGTQSKGLASSITAALDLKSRIVRITISARTAVDYNEGAFCIPGFHLTHTLLDSRLVSALYDPRLEVIVLTVYDGTSFSDCETHSYLNPDFYSPVNISRMLWEYYEFVYRLHVLFHGTGKRIVLSNWESDNAVYCGDAPAFVSSPDFRARCLRDYPRLYAGNASPDDSLNALVLWFAIRQYATDLASRRALDERLTGVSVEHAPEISSVNLLHRAGYPDVLHNVLPRIRPRAVSFSSYEALSCTDPKEVMTRSLEQIAAVSGTRAIFLGEFAYSRTWAGESWNFVTRAAARAALDWGVEFIIIWCLYASTANADYGLIDQNGGITAAGDYFAGQYQRIE